MSDGVKLALVAGGVGIAAYVVIQATKPKVVPSNVAPSSTATAFVSGIVSGLGSIFGSSKSSAPANAPLTNIDTYQQGYEDAYFGANEGPNTASVQDTEQGFAIAQNPLSIIPGFD